MGAGMNTERGIKMKCIHGVYDARCCSVCTGLVLKYDTHKVSEQGSKVLMEKLFAIGAKTKSGYGIYFRSEYVSEVQSLTKCSVSTLCENFSQFTCKDVYLQLVAAK